MRQSLYLRRQTGRALCSSGDGPWPQQLVLIDRTQSVSTLGVGLIRGLVRRRRARGTMAYSRETREGHHGSSLRRRRDDEESLVGHRGSSSDGLLASAT